MDGMVEPPPLLPADRRDGYNLLLEDVMVTIALPSDIEGPLSEQARRRGMTPEQLAIETLRASFPADETQESQPKGTLFDFLSGYVGTVDGTAEPLARETGRIFADGLEEKKRRGHL